MQKKQFIFLFVFNIFLVFLWWTIVWGINNHTISSLGLSIESTMWTTVKDIKQANFLGLQSHLVDTLATAKQSVVSVVISKDIKVYVDDPTQLYGPWNIKEQTTTLWWWSGILVSKKWYILTNKHVVQDTNAKYAVVLSNGQIYNVDKVWSDSVLDIAILKIVDTDWNPPEGLIPTNFLSLATDISVGQFVFAIGNTIAKYPNTVTMWILWGKNKSLTINGNNLYIGLYQTDAQSNPGNSGGPLIDINGNTLAIITAISEWEGISFALPISQEFIENTITSIETFGKITRPIMGIQYLEITPTIKKEKNLSIDAGIYLTDILSDLPAWEAWLKAGDSILSVNWTPITKDMPFLYQLYTHVPWDTIELEVFREGKSTKIPVLLGWNTQ